MARPDKEATVSDLASAFRTSSAVLVTEYRGLTMAQLTELRRALGMANRYVVAKNTLTRIAVRETGVSGVEELLSGPSALAFITGDPVDAAKAIREFSKSNAALVVKGGVLDGRPLTSADVSKLASLESREVLLAKLAGALNATTSKAAGLFAAPLSQVARLAAALQEQKAA